MLATRAIAWHLASHIDLNMPFSCHSRNPSPGFYVPINTKRWPRGYPRCTARKKEHASTGPKHARQNVKTRSTWPTPRSFSTFLRSPPESSWGGHAWSSPPRPRRSPFRFSQHHPSTRPRRRRSRPSPSESCALFIFNLGLDSVKFSLPFRPPCRPAS